MKRGFLGVLILLWLFMLGEGDLWAQPAKKEKRGQESQESDSQEVILRLKGVYLEEFSESGRTLELWAESAKYSRLEQQVELSKVRVMAPPKQGGTAKQVELTGNSGQADMEKKVVHIQGDVRILTEDGYRIHTEQAYYDYEAREIEGTDKVYMEGPEGITEGTGLHVWIEKEMVLLREDVKTVLSPEALLKAKEKIKP